MPNLKIEKTGKETNEQNVIHQQEIKFSKSQHRDGSGAGRRGPKSVGSVLDSLKEKVSVMCEQMGNWSRVGNT